MKTIKINGKDYPVLFNMRALSNFEKATGTPLGKLEFSDMKLEDIAQLCLAGLREGGRKAKKPLTDSEDVDWFFDAMDEDAKLISSIVATFSEQRKKK